ncbi:MAG: hypothetical protein OIF50_00275 [Flavobacteriaceae bacterium]|nr:hypothetical protein [Flavobacteriaceae bacterium]
MKNAFLDQKRKEFLIEFKPKSDYELVNCFNRETSHRGWTGVRGVYILALMEAIRSRNIDVFAIESKDEIQLKHPVYLDVSDGEKTLVPILDLKER